MLRILQNKKAEDFHPPPSVAVVDPWLRRQHRHDLERVGIDD